MRELTRQCASARSCMLLVRVVEFVDEWGMRPSMPQGLT